MREPSRKLVKIRRTRQQHWYSVLALRRTMTDPTVIEIFMSALGGALLLIWNEIRALRSMGIKRDEKVTVLTVMVKQLCSKMHIDFSSGE